MSLSSIYALFSYFMFCDLIKALTRLPAKDARGKICLGGSYSLKPTELKIKSPIILFSN